MMAHLKMNLAVMAILFATLLQVEADLSDTCKQMSPVISYNLSVSEQANPERVLEYAKGLTDNHPAFKEFFAAWEHMIGQSSLESCEFKPILEIAECRPEDSNALTTLTQATKKYATRCLTPDRIWADINSKLGLPQRPQIFEYLEKFIDRQFIDDYKMNLTAGSTKAAAAKYRKSIIAKAVNRNKEDAENLDNDNLYFYLTKNLYQPCRELVNKLEIHIEHLETASKYVGGFDELVASLDEQTQNYVFRYIFCKDMVDGDEVWSVENTQEIWSAINATSS